MANADEKPKMTITKRLAFGAVGLSLLTSACTGVRGELEESGQPIDEAPTELAFEGEPEVADLEGTQVNFAFRAPELYTGDMVEGAELFADAPLIMVFAVPSCDVCHVEGPKLARAAEIHPEINYVVVHSFGTTDEYLDYIDNSGLIQENVLHLVDAEGVLWERFGVVSQPSSVLVDTDGLVTTSRGALGDDGLARAAAQVTGAPVLDHTALDIELIDTDDPNSDGTAPEGEGADDPSSDETVPEETAPDETAPDETAPEGDDLEGEGE